MWCVLESNHPSHIQLLLECGVNATLRLVRATTYCNLVSTWTQNIVDDAATCPARPASCTCSATLANGHGSPIGAWLNELHILVLPLNCEGKNWQALSFLSLQSQLCQKEGGSASSQVQILGKWMQQRLKRKCKVEAITIEEQPCTQRKCGWRLKYNSSSLTSTVIELKSLQRVCLSSSSWRTRKFSAPKKQKLRGEFMFPVTNR